MDGDSEAVEVINDIVSDEEMGRHFFVVFNHVHEFLNTWDFALDGGFCGGDRGIQGGDRGNSWKAPDESLAGQDDFFSDIAGMHRHIGFHCVCSFRFRRISSLI